MKLVSIIICVFFMSVVGLAAHTEIPGSILKDENPKFTGYPSPRTNEFDKAIFWIKDAYHTWISKDHSVSTRLLLLSFGLVGIIGIRRKLKKP